MPQTGGEKLIPENWRYPVINEIRIEKEAIEFVSQKLKLNKEWIRKVHEHQWCLVYEYLERGETVYIPGMFRTMVRVDHIDNIMKTLDQQRNKIRRFIEATKQRIEKCKKNPARSVHTTRRKHHENKLCQLKLDEQDVNDKLREYQELLLTKTSVVLKPSREELHEKQIDEDNKKRKMKNTYRRKDWSNEH